MAMVPAARRVGAFASTQKWRRTAASTSTKVGSALAYQAACRVGSGSEATRAASRMVRLKGPSRHGVGRATARGLQCRWVWKPRWARTSAKVTAAAHRLTYQAMIGSTQASWSVQKRAKGRRFPDGSRRSTQRHGRGVSPSRGQSAVPVARSMASCQVHGEPLAGVPIDRRRVPGGPRRVGVGEPLLQPRLPRPLLGLDARRALGRRWDRVVELGAEQQPRDEPPTEAPTEAPTEPPTEPPTEAPAGEPEAGGGEGAVAHQHQLTLGLPAADEHDEDLGVLGGGAVARVQRPAQGGRARRDRQHGQCPVPRAPRARHEQPEAAPLDAFARRHMAGLRAHRVGLATFQANRAPPAPFKGPIDEQHQRRIGGDHGRHEQGQEDPAQAQRRPPVPIEDAVRAGAMPLVTAARGTQSGRDRPPPAGQQRPRYEREGMGEGWTGERDGDRLEHGEQQGGSGQHTDTSAPAIPPFRSHPRRNTFTVCKRANVESTLIPIFLYVGPFPGLAAAVR